MKITVPNRPPYFSDGSTSLGSVSVRLNSLFNFPIPAYTDPDLEIPVVSFSQISTPTLSLALTGADQLTISPTTFTEVGTHSIYVHLSDSIVTVKFPLSIVVTNTAPYISSPTMPFSNKEVAINHKITIPFTCADLESNPITVTIYETFSGVKVALPSLISSLTSPGLITVYPKFFADLGPHLFEIVLSDGQPLSRVEKLTVNVVNHPPYFIKQIPFSVTMKFNLTYEYILPPTADDEGNPIYYYLLSTPSVNIFTKQDPDRFFFNPTLWPQMRTYNLQLILSDLQANSTPFDFSLTITNLAPRFQSKKPSDQKVQLSKEFTYLLPSMIEDENNPITVINTKMPNFVTFRSEDNSYLIAPVNPANSLGIFNVKGYMTDTKLMTDFDFQIEVYNNPPKFKQNPRNLKASILAQNTFDLSIGEDEEGLPIKYKVTLQDGSPLPLFMKYVELENRLYVKTEKLKDLGSYQLMMCITDGYSNPVCGRFTLTVEDPIKSKRKKKESSNGISIDDETEKLQQVKATIAITKIQRDGELTLVVFAQKGSQEVAAAIDNETIAFQIPTKEYQNVKFTIESYNPFKAEIKIKLNFTDPKSISSGIEQDVLEAIITDEIHIQTEKYIATLKYQSSAKKTIPPQIIESLKFMASKLKDGNLQISDSLAVNFLFSLFIQYIWNMLDDFSFLTINTMISLNVPGIVQLVTSVLINFIYVDILLTDLWLPQLFETQTYEEEGQELTGLNTYFEQNGFQTKVLIKNMGSTFVYLAIFLFLILFYVILTPLARYFSKINQMRNFISRQLFMKYTLILFFSQFPPMFLSGLINIFNVNFHGILNSVSTASSFIILAFIPFGLIATWLLIRHSRQRGEKEDFMKKYGELKSDDFKPSIIGSYWKVIVTLRWAVTLLIMVFVRDHYELQIMSLLSISVFFQAIILGYQPMVDSTNQKMSMFNEVATSFYMYIIMLLTEFMGETGLRDEIGWGLLILVVGVVVINFLRVLSNIPGFLKTIFFSLKKCLSRSKRSRSAIVAIKPTLNPKIDYSTISHKINLFSRNPMEHETNQLQKNKRDMMSTICFAQNFNQKEIVEENKMPDFHKRTQINRDQLLNTMMKNNNIAIEDSMSNQLRNTQFQFSHQYLPNKYTKGVDYSHNSFNNTSLLEERDSVKIEHRNLLEERNSEKIEHGSLLEEKDEEKVNNEFHQQLISAPAIQWKSSIISNI